MSHFHTKPRIALAHDWCCGYRGGEAVLDAIARVADQIGEAGPLFVMFDDGAPLAKHVDRIERRASFLTRVPGATRFRRWLLPFYPEAVAHLGGMLGRAHATRPFDLLVSTSSAAIKGLRAPPGVPHLCYCHTPARYLWSIEQEYADSWLRGLGLQLLGPGLREWDQRTAAHVTTFLANSRHTARLIDRCYAREARVVYPPVRTDFFTPDERERGPEWLVVGALEPYKRVDLAIDAANLAKHPLLIAGKGSVERELRARAGPTVRFLGRVSNEELRDRCRSAALLLFPQVEDFGIIAVEAQACGMPVVARAAGGALETVIEGKTGAFFDEPTPEAIVAATRRAWDVKSEACRANAERFGEDVFERTMRREIMGRLGLT